MRLLNVDTFAFCDFLGVTPPPYVIASHRWSGTEASWEDIVKKINTETTGYRKVQGFATYVKTYLPLVKWLWLDSCCIKQHSDRELSEALNSMFRWYREAEVCLAWLEDVPTAADPIDQSVWFRRGWTLQELLAPDLVILLSRDWQVIGHKGKSGYGRSGAPIQSGPSLEGHISRITGIPKDIIHSYDASKYVDEEAKFSWMNGRETLRGEDMSYCLLGIMDVNMNVRYSDGEEKTRERLLRKITKRRGLAAPGQFDVPFSLHGIPNTDFFAARECDTHKLVNYFTFTFPNERSSQRRVFVVHGMGGMGKTQLCAHFAKSHATKFSAVFWLDGSSKDGLLRAMASAAARLPRPTHGPNLETEDVYTSDYFLHWLSLPGNINWLLVVDNIDRDWQHGQDPQAYNYIDLLPQADHGNVVITTRLSRLMRPNASLQLTSVDDALALKMVETRTGQAVEGIELLISKLGGLPLALAQAGAYLRETGMTVPEYMQHYEDTWEELMQYQDQFPPQEYPKRSVLTTWKISYRQVESVNPLAARILDLWAFLHHGDIWPELILAGQSDKAQRRAAHNEFLLPVFFRVTKLAIQHSIGVLVQYSMVNTRTATHPHSVHPVVHLWCISNIQSATLRQQMLTTAIWLIANMGDSSLSDTKDEPSKEIGLRLAAHTKAVGHRAEDLPDSLLVAIDCFTAAGNLSVWELSDEVERLYRHALRIFEIATGEDHPIHAYTFMCCFALGEFYRAQNRFAEAETMLNRSLRWWDQTSAEGEYYWQLSANSLARLYKAQGRLADAEEMLGRVLAIQERKMDADHGLTIVTASSLADLYFHQGKVSEAEAMWQRLIRRHENAYAGDRSVPANALAKLGIIYRTQGKFSEAEGMIRRALDAFEKASGADHHTTLLAVYGLGGVYHDQGRIEEALRLYHRALAGLQKLPWYSKEKVEKVKHSIEKAQREMTDTCANQSHTEELDAMANFAARGRQEYLQSPLKRRRSVKQAEEEPRPNKRT